MNKAFEVFWNNYVGHNQDDVYGKPLARVAYEASETSSAARIAELEADCKVMAERLAIFCNRDDCSDSACLIAAKYREEGK